MNQENDSSMQKELIFPGIKHSLLFIDIDSIMSRDEVFFYIQHRQLVVDHTSLQNWQFVLLFMNQESSILQSSSPRCPESSCSTSQPGNLLLTLWFIIDLDSLIAVEFKCDVSQNASLRHSVEHNLKTNKHHLILTILHDAALFSSARRSSVFTTALIV